MEKEENQPTDRTTNDPTELVGDQNIEPTNEAPAQQPSGALPAEEPSMAVANDEAEGAEQSDTNGSPVTEQEVESPVAEPQSHPDPESVTAQPKPRAKTVWYGIIAALVLLVGGVAAFLTLSSTDDTKIVSEQPTVAIQQKVTTLGATIATIEGKVQFSPDGETWTDAVGGESLAHLDYIRTLSEGRAIVLFDDGSVARLDSDTELYLSSLEADGLEVTLMDGQVYSRVIESESQSFTVVTANERFKSLGTAYKTSTDGTKDVLEVYQSNVKVESEDLEVPEGNKYDTEKKELAAIDLDELKTDDFAQWNKDRDSESDEFKDKLGVLAEKPEEETEPAPPTDSSSSAGITLSAKKTDSGVKLSWTLSGVSSANGFKIVRDKTDDTPSYGKHDAQYVGADALSHNWQDDSGTYYYRVCIYRESGTCDTYSNSVQATSPEVEKEAVKSGDITLTINGNKLSWTLVGGNAPHGFKVVLDSKEDPEYPEDSIQYVGADKKTVTLPEKSPGTYYVRVCKYTNGTQTKGCVDYSNEVQFVVPGGA